MPKVSKQSPTLLVIIGITGDLATRKILPALDTLATRQALPEDFQVIGISRQAVSVKQLLAKLPARRAAMIRKHGWLDKHISMFRMDLSQDREYDRLADYLQSKSKTFSPKAQILFYLSVPPQVSQPISNN